MGTAGSVAATPPGSGGTPPPPVASAEPDKPRKGSAEPEKPKRKGLFGGTRQFIGESASELKKVEWPTQSQLVTGTVVVLVACVIVGFFLYVNDQVWQRVV